MSFYVAFDVLDFLSKYRCSSLCKRSEEALGQRKKGQPVTLNVQTKGSTNITHLQENQSPTKRELYVGLVAGGALLGFENQKP